MERLLSQVGGDYGVLRHAKYLEIFRDLRSNLRVNGCFFGGGGEREGGGESVVWVL